MQNNLCNLPDQLLVSAARSRGKLATHGFFRVGPVTEVQTGLVRLAEDEKRLRQLMEF
ncbi:MAG: hypothetical protein SVM79_06785 [Chloroflexota bacterium]|nr:hypothetical protein [Chloroflexota bacterium]